MIYDCLAQPALELCYFAGLAKWTNAERYKLVEVARGLGGPPDELSAVIKIESGFDPAALNPSSGASGLIQWMPGPKGSAATIHRTTTAAIRAMSVCAQLDLARDYFEETLPTGRWRQPGDFYVAVAGGPYSAGSPGAKANPGWDLNKDGAVSLAEIRALAVGVQNAACSTGKRIAVAPESCASGGILRGIPILPLISIAAVGGVIYYFAR